MRKESHELYQESFEFICKNFNITSNQIPNHLLQYWISPDIEKQPSGNYESLDQLSVFILAYSVNQARKGNTSYTIEEESFLESFMSYQCLLNIEYLHRQINIGFKPVLIFNFDNYGDKITLNINANDLEIYKSLLKNHT